ncbi:DUF6231 family protein [Allohahella marinimesophila]|uniref:DUF6231 family protein n=1 Tax=Allohahella marinimesophila TaxID=1054972 RepID=A0ABP7Q9W8_9GAMM
MEVAEQSTIHDSPVGFINAWVLENRFREVAFLGSAPPLSPAQMPDVRLSDASGMAPLELLGSAMPPDCLVISDYLESMQAEAATQMLAGYRNALIVSVIVFVDLAEAPLSAGDFVALGFHHRASFVHDAHRLEAFEYNINSYNFKRLWNNSENWANPENFGKYWW